jgi:hypothetical protein
MVKFMFDVRPNLQHPPLLDTLRGLHISFEQAISSLRGLEKRPPDSEGRGGISCELRTLDLTAGATRRTLQVRHTGVKQYGK